MDTRLEYQRATEAALERVRAAVEEFYVAAAEVARVMEEFRDRLDQPEGLAAIQRAAHQKAQAINKYRLALESCSDAIAEWERAAPHAPEGAR
jgi:hypothetical protein